MAAGTDHMTHVPLSYWQQTPDDTILIGGCGSVAPGEDIGVWTSQPTEIVQAALKQVTCQCYF